MLNKKRLFLVDGMSNIFRSYYAIRGLSNSKGLPTNSVYGVTMTLRKLIKDHKPDYLGFVLDSKERTVRHEKFADYKAHRPDMPEDLQVQMPYIERLCDALRVPVIKLSRYEADDIMGTLAHQAAEKGLQTIIVTSDKDLAQLVIDPAIQILRVDKTGEAMLDEAGVKAKYGVNPNQIVDWIGLMGDAVDGIPGAPGIGEKGAVQLLEEFGSVEGALEGWEKVKKKTYRESLRDFAEQIRVSRELARIDLNVGVNLNLEALTLEDPDPQLAYELFSELEFAQLTREFAEGATKEKGRKAGKSVETKYRRLAKTEELRKLVDSLFDRDRFGFSLAENAAGRLAGVAFSTAPNTADYFDLENSEDREEAVRLLKEVFENGLIEKTTYHLKQAYHLLGAEGIPLENVTDDAMIQAYLIEPERTRYDIPSLAYEFLSAEINVEEENKVAQTADISQQLADVLCNKIEDDSLQYDFQQEKLDFLYQKIEMPLIPLLYEMERAGFRIDPQVLAKLSVEMGHELEKLTVKIHQLAGREFNIASTSQLGEIFEELNFEVSRRTTTGKISTSRDILEELAGKYELPRLIIEHRELAKLKGTYVDTLPSLISPEDGRIHTTLRQTATATGRVQSIDPNLQNIPVRTDLGQRIRRAFIPADGHVLLSADYSQIELRLLAHITKDPVMVETFGKGEDIHSRTAAEIFGAKNDADMREARRLAKIVNFGIAYVIGPFGLAQRVGISRSEAKKVIDGYYRTYAGVKKYMDELPELARQNNCMVRTIFGRLRRLPDLKSRGTAQAKAEREAINLPMQGSASDIVKLAMLRVTEALRREKLKARMILQVHDELVFEVPKKEVKQTTEIVKQAMEYAAKLDVPMVVEVGAGDNWMEA